MSPDRVRRLMAYLKRRAEEIGTAPHPSEIVAALGCDEAGAVAAVRWAERLGILRVRAGAGGWPAEFLLLEEGLVLAPLGLRRVSVADMVPDAPVPAPAVKRWLAEEPRGAMAIAAE